ncbi:site-specific recombinase XerD [Fontibacillus solani]|uniref:Site-specific recombinase XerD n=1 Tax=Fontibacillus solani TaxID=1572857 RepID=A0A7W3XU26_9BACL|nr:site-specific integrase [Fontibacillus solani]MBA9088397.1 site-specific recombinase XerD [Fontibacillus solani]
MTDFEFQIENFMLYCTSRNLAKKTLSSYEQTLRLFGAYLRDHFEIEDAKKVQSGHIRQFAPLRNIHLVNRR